MPHLHVDGARLLCDLDALAAFGRLAGGGVSRVAFSEADMAARRWVEGGMRELGMRVVTDPAGNSIGTYPASGAVAAPIALGSHTDSVPEGGRFDGALGVLAALACVRAVRDAGLRLHHPVEVINFTAEEATMAGTLGSRAMTGLLDRDVLASAAWDGRPITAHLAGAGIDPDDALRAARAKGALAAYLELHIEQGGILESTRTAIGIVEGIVGIRRYRAAFRGRANHAGTTPMNLRQDALVAAAPFVQSVRDIALARGIVGTVGALRVHPGAGNVIPGRVELEAEIRGLDETVLDAAERDLLQAAGDRAEIRRTSYKEPVMSDARLVRTLEDACRELEMSYRRMSSGAGHDAMCVAAIAPMAMIFVPSRGGVSHSPDEFTDAADCAAGADVLLSALLRLDAAF